MGFMSALALIFVVLKLVGVIAWSWWWVISPLWIEAIVVVALFAGGLLLGGKRGGR